MSDHALVLDWEYQGTVTCSFDPCSYCREPARTTVVAHPNGPFPSYNEAFAHAVVMSSNVYGSSAHRSGVQRRMVGQWHDATSDQG